MLTKRQAKAIWNMVQNLASCDTPDDVMVQAIIDKTAALWKAETRREMKRLDAMRAQLCDWRASRDDPEARYVSTGGRS